MSLFNSIRDGHFNVVKLFIKNVNFNINDSIDIFGDPPLHLAISYKQNIIAKLVFSLKKRWCKFKCKKLQWFSASSSSM